MATVSVETHVDALPARVWNQVRDIRWPEALTDMIVSVEPTSDTTRDCAVNGGGLLKETIVSVDDSIRRVSYTITESPFGMTGIERRDQDDGSASRAIRLMSGITDHERAAHLPDQRLILHRFSRRLPHGPGARDRATQEPDGVTMTALCRVPTD